MQIAIFQKGFSKEGVISPIFLDRAWGIKELTPKETLDFRELYNFESDFLFGNKESGFWLKKIYGGFMHPPPEKERLFYHNITIK